MGKERMALERFNDGNNSIVAPHSQIIALGNVMGEDNPRPLPNSRENS
jgi:hypothetical protein